MGTLNTDLEFDYNIFNQKLFNNELPTHGVCKKGNKITLEKKISLVVRKKLTASPPDHIKHIERILFDKKTIHGTKLTEQNQKILTQETEEKIKKAIGRFEKKIDKTKQEYHNDRNRDEKFRELSKKHQEEIKLIEEEEKARIFQLKKTQVKSRYKHLKKFPEIEDQFKELIKKKNPELKQLQNIKEDLEDFSESYKEEVHDEATDDHVLKLIKKMRTEIEEKINKKELESISKKQMEILKLKEQIYYAEKNGLTFEEFEKMAAETKNLEGTHLQNQCKRNLLKKSIKRDKNEITKLNTEGKQKTEEEIQKLEAHLNNLEKDLKEHRKNVEEADELIESIEEKEKTKETSCNELREKIALSRKEQTAENVNKIATQKLKEMTLLHEGIKKTAKDLKTQKKSIKPEELKKSLLKLKTQFEKSLKKIEEDLKSIQESEKREKESKEKSFGKTKYVTGEYHGLPAKVEIYEPKKSPEYESLKEKTKQLEEIKKGKKEELSKKQFQIGMLKNTVSNITETENRIKNLKEKINLQNLSQRQKDQTKELKKTPRNEYSKRILTKLKLKWPESYQINDNIAYKDQSKKVFKEVNKYIQSEKDALDADYEKLIPPLEQKVKQPEKPKEEIDRFKEQKKEKKSPYKRTRLSDEIKKEKTPRKREKDLTLAEIYAKRTEIEAKRKNSKKK